MMSSVPAYNDYAERVLMPEMDQAVLAEIKSLEAKGDTENPRYMELLTEQHYIHHVLRMPPADWRDPVQRGFAHINPAIYVSMQGPSELGISPGATLAHWAVRLSSRRSGCLPWSSALATTPWTRTIWR
jgi:proline iminopeptidase